MYADMNHVATAVETAEERCDEPGETVRVNVYDSEAVMRGIDFEEVERRNLTGHLGEEICTLEVGGPIPTVHFHENQLESALQLNPAGPNAIDPNQATLLSELAPDVWAVVCDAWDGVVQADFAAVEAASIAGAGHPTDFEFEYDVYK